MYSVLNWIAGVALTLAPVTDAKWENDYGVALHSTRQAQRPLLVVLDTHRWRPARVEPVSQSRRPEQGAMLDKYTLCHVDVTTPYGRQVAEAFRAKTFPTTVIIDKTGSVRLISKIGELSDDALYSMLVTYQSGERPPVAARPVICRT
ncbi:MAG TPA: hypothetical protein VMV69_04125 [Pirellulales bacterium]|nr:hypothetical protein [Pirellulales bacterium]